MSGSTESPMVSPDISETTSVITHIVRNILASPMPGPIQDALDIAGVAEIEDLMAITDDDIDQMTTLTNAKGESISERKLDLVSRRKLKDLIKYSIKFPNEDGTPDFSHDTWLMRTKAEFEAWRVLNKGMANSVMSTPPRDTTSPPAFVTRRTRHSSPKFDHDDDDDESIDDDKEADNFQKGNKRDATSYPKFVDDKQYEHWRRETHAIARMHDVDKVFDPNYIPNNPSEEKWFKKVNYFMYAVFSKVLCTAVGRQLVRKNERSGDAQLIATELAKHYESGVVAKSNAAQIRESLATLKISTWKGTCTSFLNRWESQWMALDNLTPLEHQESAPIRKTMLVAAVEMNHHLSQTQQLENLAIARGDPESNYETYMRILKTSAHQADQQKGNVSKRTNNQHSQKSSSNHHPKSSSNNQNNRNNGKSSRLPPEVWKKMTYEQRKEHWQKLNSQRSNNQNQRGRGKPGNSFSVPLELYNSMSPEQRDILKSARASRSNNQTTLEPSSNPSPSPSSSTSNGATTGPTSSTASQPLLQSIMSSTRATLPSVPERVVSSTGVYYTRETAQPHDVSFRAVNNLKLRLTHYHGQHTNGIGSLIDGGANGGFAGADVRVLEYTDQHADVTGIADHSVQNVPLATVAGLVKTTKGDAIVIMHQYAYYGKGTTVHSVGQMEHFGLEVDDRSARLPGHRQRIVTPDGWIIPLQCRDGLIRMPLKKPSDHELDSLPRIILTSDLEWNQSCLDNEIDAQNDVFHDAMATLEEREEHENYDHRYNDNGDYLGHSEPAIDRIMDFHVRNQLVCEKKVEVKQKDYDSMRPYFLWMPASRIADTFANTTQYYRNEYRTPFRKHFKSRFPAFNVRRRNEVVATDTFICDTPAIDNGAKCAQIFVGRETKYTDVYPMKTDAEFSAALEDNIRQRGAMDMLQSDNAKAQTGNKVQDLLRMYIIGDYQSEPHHQHQNPAEQHIGKLKGYLNNLLDRVGAPAALWLLALCYIAYVLNHMSFADGKGGTPIEKLTGQRAEISPILSFHFYQKVYYAVDDVFPSKSPEKSGRFVGFAQNQGDMMTFKILTDDTKKVIPRSAVRPFDEKLPNLCLDPFGNEPANKPVRSQLLGNLQPNEIDYGGATAMSIEPLTPDEIIGCTFLTKPTEDGQKF